jgi:hypothetical protein
MFSSFTESLTSGKNYITNYFTGEKVEEIKLNDEKKEEKKENVDEEYLTFSPEELEYQIIEKEDIKENEELYVSGEKEEKKTEEKQTEEEKSSLNTIKDYLNSNLSYVNVSLTTGKEYIKGSLNSGLNIVSETVYSGKTLAENTISTGTEKLSSGYTYVSSNLSSGASYIYTSSVNLFQKKENESVENVEKNQKIENMLGTNEQDGTNKIENQEIINEKNETLLDFDPNELETN